MVLSLFANSTLAQQPFSFGVVTDCQYKDEPGKGERKYDLSDKKLQEAVDSLNGSGVSFVIHLGDFIDGGFENFDVVGPIFNELKMPHYHVLGNHDFSVDDGEKASVPPKLNMPARYYDFVMNNWRFIVLDGNDVSFHAWPEGSEQYKTAEVFYEKYGNGSPKWNGAIGAEQMAWLEGKLKEATKNHEKVILFCHFPVYPENVHNLWNDEELLVLIARYPVVKAWFNGHNHAGNYAERDGVHFLTFKGMVDTEVNSWAIVSVGGGRMVVKGSGREEDRSLAIRP